MIEAKNIIASIYEETSGGSICLAIRDGEELVYWHDYTSGGSYAGMMEGVVSDAVSLESHADFDGNEISEAPDLSDYNWLEVADYSKTYGWRILSENGGACAQLIRDAVKLS